VEVKVDMQRYKMVYFLVSWKYHRMVMNSLHQRCPLNQFSRPKAVRQCHYYERDLSLFV